MDTSNSTIAILQTEKDKLDLEVTDSKKEQDDLLVLLADQDQKILSLKSKLKNLGHPVRLKYLHKCSGFVKCFPKFKLCPMLATEIWGQEHYYL